MDAGDVCGSGAGRPGPDRPKCSVGPSLASLTGGTGPVGGKDPQPERFREGWTMMGRKIPCSFPHPSIGTRRDTDPILNDLRSFAHDLGIPGCTSMSKEELVESLRQCYVLTSLQSGARQPRAR